MRRIILSVFFLLSLFWLTSKTALAACSYSCGACYQGQSLCTDGGFYCPNVAGCPPYTVTWCYDYFQSCGGGPTPTGGMTSCGPGYYGCNENSQPGFCCPVGGPTPWPTSGPGGPGCTPSCGGGYCGWKDDGCGNNCACNECEMCTLKCGQAKDCGGSCANTDAGAPGAVSIVSPNGSAASPTLTGDSTPPLQWGAVAGVADRYYIEMYDNSNTLVWSRYVNTIGTTGVDTGITLTAGQPYHWRIRAENTTCATEVGTWSSYGYVKLNSSPTISCLIYKNSNGVTVAWDSGNRGQIMNPSISGTASPRTVIFQACVDDVDGGSDIVEANIQWNGTTYPMTLGTPSGTGLTASVTINFGAASNGNSALPISFSAQDVITNASPLVWSASGYSFKVWDGTVSASGTMYDSSDSALGAQCPSGEGFNTPAGASMNFNWADFTPTVGTAVRINATSDSAYSGGGIVWGKTYLATPNSDIMGGSVIDRWIDLGIGTTNCGNQVTVTSAVVDPYNTSPSLRVDFSSASGQPGWYQVSNGGIQAVGTVTNIVPVTCGLDATCTGAMTIANNTLVSGLSITNGGCVLGDANCQYGNPNNWYRIPGTLSSAEKYDYRYFYDRYFVGYGAGVTLPANSNMTAVNANGGTGVYFIDGNFTVNENNTVNSGQTLFIIAKGSITFDQAVTQSQGIFVADGGMTIAGTNTAVLVISGSLYSASSTGNISFTREFTSAVENNNKPATVVNYRPDLIFNLPGSMLKVLSGWKQN